MSITPLKTPQYTAVNENDYRMTLSDDPTGSILTVNRPTSREFDHSCEICTKKFAVKSQMEGHIFYSHAFESLTCLTCKLECKLSSIKEHVVCQGSKAQTSIFSVKLLQIVFSLRLGFKLPFLEVEVATHGIKKLSVCVICQETFVEFETFNKHVIVHHSVEKFQCLSCKRTSKFEDILDHVVSKHRKVEKDLSLKLIFKPRFVPVPEKGTTLIFSLLGTAQNRDVYSVKISNRKDKLIHSICIICEKEFKEIEKWFQHIYDAHDSFKYYTCTNCLTVCAISDLKEHICKYSMEKCRMFRSGKRQYSIIRRNQDQLLVKVQEINFFQHDNFCFDCKVKTGVAGHDSLRKHLETKHDLRIFKCNRCEDPVQFDEFEDHIKLNHKSLDESICSMMMCMKTAPENYFTNYSLIIFDGLRLVVNNDKKEELDCTLCKCKFTNKAVFQKHLGITHRVDNFKCIQCDVIISFSHIGNHVAVHHNYNDPNFLFLCVNPEGEKIYSFLERKITYWNDSAGPKVTVMFKDTSIDRKGKSLNFDFLHMLVVRLLATL